MDTIGERLRIARETAHARVSRNFKITQSELGDMIGLTQGAIYKLESNRNKRGDVDVTKLMKAAEYLKCSFIYLATGRGSLDSDDSNMLDDLENQHGQPFYHPSLLNQEEPESSMMLNLPSTMTGKITPRAFYSLVTDNGVDPKASTGDMILVDPGADLQVGDFVLVRMQPASMPVVRRIIEHTTPDGQHGYLLKTLNPEFSDRRLERLEDILGVVLEFRTFTRANCSYKDQLTGATSSNVIQINRS